MRKKPHPLLAAAYGRAFAEGIGWTDVRKRVGMSSSRWHRLVHGEVIPKVDQIDELNAAIDALILEADAADSAD